jgi:hypothetical protein
MTATTTTWHRLEPLVRGADPAIGLSAAVHDPLWLLGRQWQFGELLGEDAASPVTVRTETVEHQLTRFRPAGGEVRDYDPQAEPLEAVVEREPPVAPTLRQRLDAWTRLGRLLAAAGLSGRAPALAAAHPLPAPRAATDPADARLRRLAGEGAGDGLAIADALAANSAGLPPELVAAFLTWVRAQFAAPPPESWTSDRLEYRFSAAAMTDTDEVVLSASGYPGGRLDWYDFDVDADPSHSLAPTRRPPTTNVSYALPTRVSFPGMPAERFWEFEDAAEDLGRLVTVEFATVFGNDWWAVPVRARFGSLVGVRSLVVTDSFGEHVLLEPTETASSATAPWRMFRLSDSALSAGSGPSPPLLLLCPVMAAPLEGDAIEEVTLLRDEMANLAWAVERVVEGADGRRRDRSIECASNQTAAPPPTLNSPADQVYILQTEVPEHWIPLVPVRDPAGSGAIVLQGGSLLTHDGSARPVTAQGVLLEPDVSPWCFHEEEVPRGGLRISRVPVVARCVDGTTWAWVGRRVGRGRGEGSSGLRFDIAMPPAE